MYRSESLREMKATSDSSPLHQSLLDAKENNSIDDSY